MYTETKHKGRPKKTAPLPQETADAPKETGLNPKETPANTLPNHLSTQLYRNNPWQSVGLLDEVPDANNFNTRMIRKNLQIANLPKIDLADADAVSARINEYFQIEAAAGFKPSVAGLANSLGIDRRRLFEIRDGRSKEGKIPYGLPESVAKVVRGAYRIMEQNWEDYMQQGQINPVSGIFLGKNNFQYQDKTEYILTPNQQSAEDLNEQQLLDRYIADSGSDSE